MVVGPEREELPVQERVEEISPLMIERKEVVTPIPKTFKAQVRDDKGQPLIQTPPTQVIAVAPPADQKTLISWAKGPISSSLTWLAAFWLRVIKKAIHFGWRIVGKEP